MATVLRSRTGAARLGTPLMILCVLAMGGFLYWLSVTAEPTEIAVEVEAVDELGGNVVAFADFSAGTAGYIGQEITLEGIAVTSLLGPHGFFTSLADAQGTPYLVHLTEEALGDSVSIVSGHSVDVTGSIIIMSDSILDAWEAAGAFPQEGDRFQAAFAENFIEVTSVVDATAGSTEPSS